MTSGLGWVVVTIAAVLCLRTAIWLWLEARRAERERPMRDRLRSIDGGRR